MVAGSGGWVGKAKSPRSTFPRTSSRCSSVATGRSLARVALVTLGCPKNAVDSEGLGGLLSRSGHDVRADVSGAEVVLVNTCGFIDAARRETIEEVLDLAEA